MLPVFKLCWKIFCVFLLSNYCFALSQNNSKFNQKFLIKTFGSVLCVYVELLFYYDFYLFFFAFLNLTKNQIIGNPGSESAPANTKK